MTIAIAFLQSIRQWRKYPPITNYTGQRSGLGWQLESNMEYVDHVETHRAAARYLEQTYPDSVIVTCWPMKAKLADP